MIRTSGKITGSKTKTQISARPKIIGNKTKILTSGTRTRGHPISKTFLGTIGSKIQTNITKGRLINRTFLKITGSKIVTKVHLTGKMTGTLTKATRDLKINRTLVKMIGKQTAIQIKTRSPKTSIHTIGSLIGKRTQETWLTPTGQTMWSFTLKTKDAMTVAAIRG